MNRQLKSWLAGAALAAAAMASHASSVTLTNWAYGSGNVVSARAPSGNYDGWAGGFGGTLSGTSGFDTDSFITYCIELEEHFWFSSTPMTGYTVIEGKRYFGEFRGDKTIADRLGKLMTYAADNASLVASAAGSTSLQLAIWNLVYDTDYTVMGTAGRFSDVSTYSLLASDLLAGAQTVATSRFGVYALQKSGSQDFLLLKPLVTTNLGEVPEPASLALAMLALGGVALAGRRRQGYRPS